MTGQQLKEIRIACRWTPAHAAKQFNYSLRRWYELETLDVVPLRISEFMEMKNKIDVPRLAANPELRATPAHLTAFRSAFNLTQEKASALLGVSRITWNRWENGQTAIPKHMLHTLRGMVAQLKSQKEESKS